MEQVWWTLNVPSMSLREETFSFSRGVFVGTTPRACAKGIGANWDHWRTYEGPNRNYRPEPPPFGISVCWFHLDHSRMRAATLIPTRSKPLLLLLFWRHYLLAHLNSLSCKCLFTGVMCLSKDQCWFVMSAENPQNISYWLNSCFHLWHITVLRQLSAHSMGFSRDCGKAWSIPSWN